MSEEIGPTSSRAVIVEAGAGGELRYRYSVDGLARPFDADARSWLSHRVQQLHRQLNGRTRI